MQIQTSCFTHLDLHCLQRQSISGFRRTSVNTCITKTRLFKYIENFTSKNWKFSDKNSDIFLISARNIDCGYSLEPPRRGSSNEYPQSMFRAEIRKIMYTPVNPSFTIQKWGLRGQNYIGVFWWCMCFSNK